MFGITKTSRLINAFPGNQVIRLLPEHHLGKISEVPAVGNDTVLRRQKSGQERCLNGAGDGWKYRLQWTRKTGLQESADVRSVLTDHLTGETNNVDHHESTMSRCDCHHLRSLRRWNI